MRFVLLIFLVLFAFNVEAAETTYHCSHFQSDIDYWQAEYIKVVKANKELYKDLMDAKMKTLEQGIKIPKALKDTKIILHKGAKKTSTHYHYYYN